MKFCSKCGKEIMDEAIVCPGCGCAVVSPTTPALVASANDEVSVGLCILAVLIPLFGIIYWPLKHTETPKKAKACGIAALISWGVGILFYFILMAIMGAAIGSIGSLL